MSNAVVFDGVWKKFKKGEKFGSLRDAVPGFIKKISTKTPIVNLKEQEFWAVKDVNFTIPKGGVVGVMGPNGAGKSTVLKLLSGIMSPTKGKMTINGRLSALIEVTAGFHPELTGRENVYLNGTILGMKRKEIDNKFDEIVAFSGVEEFIDTPVKRYSSGMYSRLGFSVAAHMDPEILIVDEVLSVGDVSFQAKCAQKMRELLSSGSTILLVSHQISLIQSLCKRVILLNHGELVKDGPTDDVIPFYQNIIFKRNEEEFKRKISVSEGKVKVKQDSILDINKINILGQDGIDKEDFSQNEDLSVQIDYTAKQAIQSPIVILEIVRSDGVLCCTLNSKDFNLEFGSVNGHAIITINFPKFTLSPGIYLTKVSFWDREMMHPYAIHSNKVFRMKSLQGMGMSNSVFLPQTSWVM